MISDNFENLCSDFNSANLSNFLALIRILPHIHNEGEDPHIIHSDHFHTVNSYTFLDRILTNIDDNFSHLITNQAINQNDIIEFIVFAIHFLNKTVPENQTEEGALEFSFANFLAGANNLDFLAAINQRVDEFLGNYPDILNSTLGLVQARISDINMGSPLPSFSELAEPIDQSRQLGGNRGNQFGQLSTSPSPTSSEPLEKHHHFR